VRNALLFFLDFCSKHLQLHEHLAERIFASEKGRASNFSFGIPRYWYRANSPRAM